jgi:hypothetical protein
MISVAWVEIDDLRELPIHPSMRLRIDHALTRQNGHSWRNHLSAPQQMGSDKSRPGSTAANHARQTFRD